MAAITTSKKPKTKIGDQNINQVFGQVSQFYQLPAKDLPTDSYNGDIQYSVHDATKNFELKNNKVFQDQPEFLQNKQVIKIDNPNSFKPLNTDLVPRNQNTGIENQDFPGMFGLPVPSPATLSNLGTGNGRGGEIINRSQIKNAAEGPRPGYDSFGNELQPRKSDLKYDIYQWLKKPVQFFSGLGPVGFTYDFAKKGPWHGAAAGAGALGLAGLLGAYLHNKLSDDQEIVYDEYGNAYENPEVKQKKKNRYLKYGLGAALAGTLLGHAFGTEHQNFGSGDNTKKASVKKLAFGFPHPDANFIIYQLNNKINSDNHLSFAQKNELMNQIRSLPASSLADFYPIIGMASGAGIGYAIAKKLLSLGKTGSILMSILGGVVGTGIGLNGFQNSIPTFDPFNSPFRGFY